MSSKCIKYPVQALVGANVRLAGLKKRSGSTQRGQVVQHHLPEIGMSHLNPTEISPFSGDLSVIKVFFKWVMTFYPKVEFRGISIHPIFRYRHITRQKKDIGKLPHPWLERSFEATSKKDHRDEEESSSYTKHLLKHRSLLCRLTSSK